MARAVPYRSVSFLPGKPHVPQLIPWPKYHFNSVYVYEITIDVAVKARKTGYSWQ
jgi:hypothetical protein